MAHEHVLDVGGMELPSASVDLLAPATADRHVAVAVPRGDIPREEPAVRREALRGGDGIVHVAFEDPRTTHAELPLGPRRRRGAVAVDDPHGPATRRAAHRVLNDGRWILRSREDH